ncbi:MAG: hypothetical protein ACLFMT_04630 [Halobacteriales archaeon]
MSGEQASLDDESLGVVGQDTGSCDAVVQDDAIARDEVVEVVEQRIEEDVYPRLSNIYSSLERRGGAPASDVPENVELRPEVQRFYDGYTAAFEASVEELAAELLEEEARRLSEELESVSGEEPSWLLEE